MKSGFSNFASSAKGAMANSILKVVVFLFSFDSHLGMCM